jgi:hypothetical protein
MTPANAYATVPLLTRLTPTSGPRLGGTTVTLLGADFVHIRAVVFGKDVLTRFKIISSKKITVRSPRHATGSVWVQVRSTSGGLSSKRKFTYSR